VTTWSELLDDYEAAIVALEAALASGAEPDGASWAPPAALPSEAPNPEQHARFLGLQARGDACATRLRAALTDVTADLDTLRRTGAAARAYGAVGDLAAP
jgi:hypothetical protein